MAKVDDRLLDLAKRMRREPSPIETRLWFELRAKRLGRIKFSRQVVIGPYIADFAARSVKLVVEVDGDTHSDQARDEQRTASLRQQGYRVIRFSNADVTGDMDGVWRVIDAAPAASHPSSLPDGEREQKSICQ